MRKRAITFESAASPIREEVSKFGGQPVWVTTPEWPLSASTNRPMRFICQIKLDTFEFGSFDATMAYIFMTDEEEYVDDTWEPDGGENAVVIEPNGINSFPSVRMETGPTLFEMRQVPGEKLRKPFPCEFLVMESESEDLEEEANEFENKIGGNPHFLQGEGFPDARKDDWLLLLQLDSCSVPFDINFGDAGVGYAFISRDGRTGKFLWRCA